MKLVPKVIFDNVLKKEVRLGKGTYGSVYSATTYRGDANEYAVKRNIIDKDITFMGSLKELDLLSKVKGHPFIIDLLAVSYKNPFNKPLSPIKDHHYREDELFFIFEKGAYDGHTLIHGGTAAYGYLKMAMVQLFIGIEYLHGKGIIHRDLKPSNLLWFRYGRQRLLKICDFGLSKVFSRQELGTPRLITSWYRPPEIIFKWDDYCLKSDIWSIGCILYEMITKKALLSGTLDKSKKLLEKLLRKLPHNPQIIRTLDRYTKFTSSINKYYQPKTFKSIINLPSQLIKQFNQCGNYGTYDNYINLLSHLLDFNPTTRYSATQALNHPFFKDYTNYIKKIRQLFPPIQNPYPILNIDDSVERFYASQIIFTIYNQKEHYYWYKHRILFLAFDIFDRYLHHLNISKKKDNNHHSKFEIEIRIMVCLYIAIKYFTTLKRAFPYTDLVNRNYRTSNILQFAKEFEIYMINNILKFNIHRLLVIEVADELNIKLSEDNIRQLLIYYGQLKNKFNINARDLFFEVFPHYKRPLNLIIQPMIRPTVKIPIINGSQKYVPTYSHHETNYTSIGTTHVKTAQIGEKTAKYPLTSTIDNLVYPLRNCHLNILK